MSSRQRDLVDVAERRGVSNDPKRDHSTGGGGPQAIALNHRPPKGQKNPLSLLEVRSLQQRSLGIRSAQLDTGADH